MPQDALNSFRSLLDKIPAWIAGLEAVLENATQRQNELLLANQAADSDRTLVRKRSKTSSTRSKRSKHSDHDEQALHTPLKETTGAETNTPVPTLLRPQLPHMTESDALRLSQRKRKTFSACSGDESGPSKYRSRAMVVIYYDGDVQKRFADFVGAVASCRNDIRKSKLNAKVDKFVRSRSLSSGSGSGSGSGGSGGEDNTKSLDTFARKTTGLRLQDMGEVGKSDSNEALSKVDAFLEQSQNLCEKAAHQVLRDGDCALEVTQAKDLLEQARSCAERAIPSLERSAAADEERRVKAEEKQRVERSRQPPPPLPADSEKIELLSRDPSNDTLEVDEIEVDDDDDESDTELDITALKLPPHLAKYSMRGTRLAAC